MIRVAKSVIIQNGKILLLKRASTSKFFPNLWDLPGGKLDSNENPETAVVRETKEETNLDVECGSLIGEYDLEELKEKIHFWVFSAEVLLGKIHLSADHTDYRWFFSEKIKNYKVTSIVQLVLKNLNL